MDGAIAPLHSHPGDNKGPAGQRNSGYSAVTNTGTDMTDRDTEGGMQSKPSSSDTNTIIDYLTQHGVMSPRNWPSRSLPAFTSRGYSACSMTWRGWPI